MSDKVEKGSFNTEVSQDLIDQAMAAVDKRSRSAEGPEVPVEVAPASSDELSALKAQLELSLAKGRELMEKLKEEHELRLRAAADLENTRKRSQKEREDVQKFGNEKLLKDFLPVIDNLDRALEHSKSASDLEGFKKGVEMTRKAFEDALAKNGVKSFSALGQPFDPHFHEAMQQVERADVPPNQVVMEVIRGYLLQDRLVRPALVVVSKQPAAPDQPSAPAEGNEPSPTPDGESGQA